MRLSERWTNVKWSLERLDDYWHIASLSSPSLILSFSFLLFLFLLSSHLSSFSSSFLPIFSSLLLLDSSNFSIFYFPSLSPPSFSSSQSLSSFPSVYSPPSSSSHHSPPYHHLSHILCYFLLHFLVFYFSIINIIIIIFIFFCISSSSFSS